MKNETFEYKGLTFKPFKNLRGGAAHFHNISKRIIDIHITPAEWNYDEFYKLAEELGLDFDLYEVNNHIVIPSNYTLWKYLP